MNIDYKKNLEIFLFWLCNDCLFILIVWCYKIESKNESNIVLNNVYEYSFN